VLAACDTTDSIVCTTEFAAVTVTVVDASGAPVLDATVTSTLVRTGETLEPIWLGLPTPGTYVIVDDGSRDKLRTSGDTVAVTAQRNAGPSTAATYFIDVPGGCHVHKVTGPDTLSVP
jgi:hypothetical protein